MSNWKAHPEELPHLLDHSPSRTSGQFLFLRNGLHSLLCIATDIAVAWCLSAWAVLGRLPCTGRESSVSGLEQLRHPLGCILTTYGLPPHCWDRSQIPLKSCQHGEPQRCSAVCLSTAAILEGRIRTSPLPPLEANSRYRQSAISSARSPWRGPSLSLL